MIRPRQLALPFPHAPDFATAPFLQAPSNAAALAWLERPAAWPGGRLVLWSPPGAGKTHLLHHWAARMGAGLLAGPALRGFPDPAGQRALAIDDADALAEEAALLHLLNAAAEAWVAVLLAGRTPPARWTLRLPDLASRLRATATVGIGPPEDALLRALLARLLADRQMVVPAAVQDWLLTRLPREAATLREIATRLDRAGLAAGGRITRPLAAAVLEAIATDAQDDPPAPPGPGVPANAAATTPMAEANEISASAPGAASSPGRGLL